MIVEGAYTGKPSAWLWFGAQMFMGLFGWTLKCSWFQVFRKTDCYHLLLVCVWSSIKIGNHIKGKVLFLISEQKVWNVVSSLYHHKSQAKVIAIHSTSVFQLNCSLGTSICILCGIILRGLAKYKMTELVVQRTNNVVP